MAERTHQWTDWWLTSSPCFRSFFLLLWPSTYLVIYHAVHLQNLIQSNPILSLETPPQKLKSRKKHNRQKKTICQGTCPESTICNFPPPKKNKLYQHRPQIAKNNFCARSSPSTPTIAHYNGAVHWHPAMAPRPLPQSWPSPSPRHSTLQWHPAMAPSNSTTSTLLKLVVTLPPTIAYCNGTLRWHPAPATEPRPLHPALAPWCHVQSAKVVRRPPPLLEVRTPIAIAIWGTKKQKQMPCLFPHFFVKENWENCNFWIPHMFPGGPIQGLGSNLFFFHFWLCLFVSLFFRGFLIFHVGLFWICFFGFLFFNFCYEHREMRDSYRS